MNVKGAHRQSVEERPLPKASLHVQMAYSGQFNEICYYFFCYIFLRFRAEKRILPPTPLHFKWNFYDNLMLYTDYTKLVVLMHNSLNDM